MNRRNLITSALAIVASIFTKPLKATTATPPAPSGAVRLDDLETRTVREWINVLEGVRCQDQPILLEVDGFQYTIIDAAAGFDGKFVLRAKTHKTLEERDWVVRSYNEHAAKAGRPLMEQPRAQDCSQPYPIPCPVYRRHPA